MTSWYLVFPIVFSSLSALESILTFCGLMGPILESISTSILLLSCTLQVSIRLHCRFDSENAKCAISRIDGRLRWSERRLSSIRDDESTMMVFILAT